jgi:hypothetical protein
LHDTKFDHTEEIIPFFDYELNTTMDIDGHCQFRFFVYATDELVSDYQSNAPLILTIVVAATFLFMALTFYMYDWFVQRRNNKVVDAAARSNAIVSSMFPETVRNRLLEDNDKSDVGSDSGAKSPLKTIMNHEAHDEDLEMDDEDGIMYKSKPIADLFPETTIMFADIPGFTAWSSMREPWQVSEACCSFGHSNFNGLNSRILCWFWGHRWIRNLIGFYSLGDNFPCF